MASSARCAHGACGALQDRTCCFQRPLAGLFMADTRISGPRPSMSSKGMGSLTCTFLRIMQEPQKSLHRQPSGLQADTLPCLNLQAHQRSGVTQVDWQVRRQATETLASLAAAIQARAHDRCCALCFVLDSHGLMFGPRSSICCE